MSKKAYIRILASSLFLILLAGARLSYSALNERIFSTIRIAYMNGYVEALQSDIEYISRIKKDRELFEKSVLEAAEKYVVSVRKMNEPEKKADSQEQRE